MSKKTIEIQATKVTAVEGAQPTDDNQVVLVLSLDGPGTVGFVFDGAQAEQAIDALMAHQPAPDGEGLEIHYEPGGPSEREIDGVEVLGPSSAKTVDDKFQMIFRVGEEQALKLTMNHRAAVRWSRQLNARISQHLKRHGN